MMTNPHLSPRPSPHPPPSPPSLPHLTLFNSLLPPPHPPNLITGYYLPNSTLPFLPPHLVASSTLTTTAYNDLAAREQDVEALSRESLSKYKQFLHAVVNGARGERVYAGHETWMLGEGDMCRYDGRLVGMLVRLWGVVGEGEGWGGSIEGEVWRRFGKTVLGVLMKKTDGHVGNNHVGGDMPTRIERPIATTPNCVTVVVCIGRVTDLPGAVVPLIPSEVSAASGPRCTHNLRRSSKLLHRSSKLLRRSSKLLHRSSKPLTNSVPSRAGNFEGEID